MSSMTSQVMELLAKVIYFHIKLGKWVITIGKVVYISKMNMSLSMLIGIIT